MRHRPSSQRSEPPVIDLSPEPEPEHADTLGDFRNLADFIADMRLKRHEQRLEASTRRSASDAPRGWLDEVRDSVERQNPVAGMPPDPGPETTEETAEIARLTALIEGLEARVAGLEADVAALNAARPPVTTAPLALAAPDRRVDRINLRAALDAAAASGLNRAQSAPAAKDEATPKRDWR